MDYKSEAIRRLSGLDVTHEAGLGDAVIALYADNADDTLLYEGLMYLKSHPQTHRFALRRIISELSGFYTDSDCAPLAKMMQVEQDKLQQKSAKSALLDTDLTGVQLLNKEGTQGVLFLPDASEPGRFRASLFDQGGFYSHLTRDHYNEVLDAVWQEGFRPTSTPMLETWAVAPAWQAGSEVTLAIQQVGLGNMSHLAYRALAQWHSNKMVLQRLAKQFSQDGLEVAQQVRLLQENVKVEFGRELRSDVALTLVASPSQRPDLTNGLFEAAPVAPEEASPVKIRDNASPAPSRNIRR